MIHNGIEYGMMQALAEGFDIMRNAASQALPAEERLDLDLGEIAEAWRRGSVITSWLLDLTAAALWVFADERWLVLDGAGDYVDGSGARSGPSPWWSRRSGRLSTARPRSWG
jgi:6-phosphogluconate dehydrogenase